MIFSQERGEICSDDIFICLEQGLPALSITILCLGQCCLPASHTEYRPLFLLLASAGWACRSEVGSKKRPRRACKACWGCRNFLPFSPGCGERTRAAASSDVCTTRLAMQVFLSVGLHVTHCVYCNCVAVNWIWSGFGSYVYQEWKSMSIYAGESADLAVSTLQPSSLGN